MHSPLTEYEKLHLLLSEAAKLWEKNQTLVTSRKFFHLWLDSCQPRPFMIPDEGLMFNRHQVVKPAEDSQERIGTFRWHESECCPCLAVETVDSTQLVLIQLAPSGASFKQLPLETNSIQDNTYGERVELMADAVARIRTWYPHLDLNKITQAVMLEALQSLQEEADPKVLQSLLKSNAHIKKALLQKVLADMAADELSAQLCFDFNEQPEVKPTLTIDEKPTAISLPLRSRWEVTQDLALLAECARSQMRREESFLLNFGQAEVITKQKNGYCVIRMPLPKDSSAFQMREGDRLQLFRHGQPRDKLGDFRLDLQEADEWIGTLIWNNPEQTSPIDDHLCGQPRRSPLGFLARAIELLKPAILTQEKTTSDILPSLLGLETLTYRRHLTAANAYDLDASQASAWGTAMDKDNKIAIIQGPPGTGKTKVVHRLTRDLCQQGASILLTAPSNAAVDNICRHLLDLPMLRHGSYQEVVMPEIAEQCWHENEAARQQFAHKANEVPGQIHASTPIGLLRSPELREKLKLEQVFDVIIFDEAGMAGTAEVLLCLGLARRAIFFGDPQQLPPFPLSPEVWGDLSDQFGVLNQEQRCLVGGSFLSWLQFHRQVPEIMLRSSYRCQNPRLMRFSANLFYNGMVTTSPRAEYYHLNFRERQERYPAATLRFINTAGLPDKQRQEQLALTGQPGMENPLEAKIAVAVLLECCQRFPLTEITLITPYRRQVKLLRKLLRFPPPGIDAAAWKSFRHNRISTVDSFQGGESDVVIISYVRSGGHSIGFVDDPNRINVTHTRCRREMIVIGDLEHLQAKEQSNIFARMERAFRRDGVIEKLNSTQLDEMLETLKVLEANQRDTEAEQNGNDLESEENDDNYENNDNNDLETVAMTAQNNEKTNAKKIKQTPKKELPDEKPTQLMFDF